jgi:transglutaminase-like putative cysteine protease
MFLPAIIALLALGHGQHRIASPAILLLVLFAALAFGWRFTGEVVIAALIMGGGAIIGLLQPAEPPSPGMAFPQPMFHALSLGTGALLVFLCLANERTAAWITSFVLIGLALEGRQNLIDILLLSALIGAVLYVPSATAGNRAGSRVFLVAVLLSAGVFALGFAAVNKTLLHMVGEWARGLDTSGVGLENQLDVSAASSIDLSMRPMIELDGQTDVKLRTIVMERFNGLTWSDADPTGHMKQTSRLPPPAPPVLTSERRKTAMLLIEPLAEVIPAPAGTYSVTGAPMRVESGWVWRTNSPVPTPLTVEWAATNELPRELPPAPELIAIPEARLAEFTAIAKEIVGDAHTAAEKARRIEAFFRDNFTYSLRTDLRGRGKDPLVVMIRERRPAYCVYFATAMALLLRTQGIPARIATGFVAWEHNPFNGRTVVRARDAHAWVEAYLPEAGRYVEFDPTPSRNLDDKPGWLSQLVDVVTSWVRRAWRAFQEDPAGTLRAIALHPLSWGTVVVLVLWWFWQRQSNRRDQRLAVLRSGDRELRQAYDRYLRALARLDVTPEASATDEDILRLLQERHGERLSGVARSFVTAYRSHRYGTGDGGARTDLTAALKLFEEAVRTEAGRKAA